MEVMTAVLILSVGMLGVAAMLNTSMKSDSYNNYAREAEYMANQKIEEFRAKSVDGSLAAGTGNWPPTAITSPYVYSWTVTPDTDTNRRICQVEVKVGWPTGPDYPDCKKDSVDKCTNRMRVLNFIPQQ